MTPGTHNFTCVRGTTQPFAFRITIEDPENPSGPRIPIPATAYHLSIKSGSTVLHVQTDTPADNFVLGEDGTGTWTPTPAQTRAFKPNIASDPDNAPETLDKPQNTYELEVWNGTDSQMVYLAGTIAAIGGINEDDA
jgi:hypothetical protein